MRIARGPKRKSIQNARSANLKKGDHLKRVKLGFQKALFFQGFESHPKCTFGGGWGGEGRCTFGGGTGLASVFCVM